MPKHNLTYSVSMTTRKMRPGERDGIDYYFVSKEEFLKRVDEGKFLEHAEFVGNYYGTPLDKVNERLEDGQEVVLEIEVEGALQVKTSLSLSTFMHWRRKWQPTPVFLPGKSHGQRSCCATVLRVTKS